MATYLYMVAHFAFLSHTQGSALEGEKPMSNMMSWIFWDHLRPELLSPYSVLYITNMCPSSSSNSGPATMYSFSLVFASKYAIPISAPQTSRLFSLAKNMTNQTDRYNTRVDAFSRIWSGMSSSNQSGFVSAIMFDSKDEMDPDFLVSIWCI